MTTVIQERGIDFALEGGFFYAEERGKLLDDPERRNTDVMLRDGEMTDPL